MIATDPADPKTAHAACGADASIEPTRITRDKTRARFTRNLSTQELQIWLLDLP
jgi:hypothetical protein